MSEPFHERLRRLRKRRGMTMRQVADRIACSVPCMHYYETGEREFPRRHLAPVADLLGVTVAELAGAHFEVCRETLGERIARLRKSVGLRQVDLAERLQAGHTIVGDWEQDRCIPMGHRVVPLARALRCSTHYLLTGREDPKHAALIAAVRAAGVRDPRVLALVEGR